MNASPIVRIAVAVALAAGVTLLCHNAPSVAAQGQDRGIAPQQETECLDRGLARIARGRRAGRVRFVGTDSGRPIRRVDSVTATSTPEASARAYLSRCAPLFGVTNQATELRTSRLSAGARNRSVVRFQQVHEGIPVVGGELIVHLDGDQDILSVNGETLDSTTVKPETTPLISADDATRTALELVARQHGLTTSELVASAPEVWIYDPSLVSGLANQEPAALVWRLEVWPTALRPIRELVLVDARRGTVPLHFNQVETALNRSTYTAGNTTDLPGTFVCGEADPACAFGDAHAAAAHRSAGDTYNFYLTVHGRNGLDNAGGPFVSTVHYGVGFANAFFDTARGQMVYGDAYGFPMADDVVGHELTHGVTQNTSRLFYYYQSGAINESFSDVWGEFVDQTNARGNDTGAVKWLMGEDTYGYGAFRNMANPPLYSHPDRMTSLFYATGTADNGGVHTNSGVNNKAAFLMVDGGTFNGQTVAPLGITKVAKIYYEVQTNLLTSGADYADLFEALFQGCTNLVGTAGITLSDCEEVRKATLAVEMHLQPVSGFNTDTPECVTGSPATLFFDGLEAGTANLALGSRWSRPSATSSANFVHTGRFSLFATDNPATIADTSVSLNSDRLLPAAAFLHFAHAFGFQKELDGGVVEYSTNGGTVWSDLGPLFEAQANGYNGQLGVSTGNPLSGRMAFTGQSHGYISSRANLASLAGRSVRFRWRMGLDGSGQDRGWYVDDVRLYTCTNPGVPTVSSIAPMLGSTSGGSSVTISGAGFLPGATVTLGGTPAVLTSLSTTSIAATTPPHAVGTFDVVVTNVGGASATLKNGFTFVAPPTATSISPASGPSLGGSAVTIAGTNFVTGTSVTIGGVPAPVVSVTFTSLTVTTPARPPGVASVVVRTPDGQTVTLANAFTYVASAPPVISTVVPATGVAAGGTTVTIVGTGFAPGATVSIGGVPAPSTVLNATTISAITGPHAVGAVNVVVTHADGQAGTLSNGFTYIVNPPPTVTAILPNRGPSPGGTPVTIFGAVFAPGATVRIAAVPATNVTVVGPGKITATTGANTGYLGSDVVVTNVTGQSGVLPLSFSYVIQANNERFAQRYPIVGTGALAVTGTNVDFTPEADGPSDFIGGSGSASAWWAWTSPCTFQVSSPDSFIDTTGSSFDTVLSLFTGSSLSALTLFAADDDSGGNLTSRVPSSGRLTITAGTTYYIRVRGYNTTPSTSTGSIRLRINSPDCLPPPTMTSMTPATGGTLTQPVVSVTGTGFAAGTVLTAGSGISVHDTTVLDSTTLTATFVIAIDAPLGPHTVSVTTPGGTVSAPAFTVQFGPPRLEGLSPSGAVKNGLPFQVVFTGNNFVPGMTIGPMAGITVSNLVVESPTRATATFTVAAGATLGTRNVLLTTTSGTSTLALTFTVANPFPDLTVSSTHESHFAAGFDESYVVTVTNVGSAPTTGVITAGELLPLGPLAIVDAGGNGWACTWGNAGWNCKTPEVLGVGASSSFPVTMAVGSSITSFNHMHWVSTPGDANTSNNNVIGDFTTVLPTPGVVASFSPTLPGARQQALATLSIAQPFPHAFSGTLTLGFTPNAVVAANDPAIQFAAGGRTVAFTFDANSTQARIGGATSPGPVAFQTGTVAGTLAFTSAYTAGTITTTRPSQSVTIARQAPVITQVQTDTQGSLQAVVTLYSTSREVTDVMLTFNTTPEVRLNCGGVPGCSAKGSTMTLDVRSPFTTWYASDSTYGSVTTLRLPLSIAGGSVTGSIAVTLRNSVGVSSPVTVPLP